ncbi:hypothetical protein ABIE87_006485 [Bradyrhizobium diazoefficiens]|uniref:hypothetical protein n=1 Tax=Bradyrhizobium diazoefficiens TaxID=1355477 RepID=UPI003518DC24
MNVVQLRPAVPEDEGITPRNPYSFEVTQPDQRGMVLIDACVPMSVALEFLQLLSKHNKA